MVYSKWYMKENHQLLTIYHQPIRILHSLEFLGKELHHGYWSSLLRTEPCVQIQDRSPHEGWCQNAGYQDTTTFDRWGYAFLSSFFPAFPIFLLFVNHPRFHRYPEPEYPWLQQFYHHHSAAYKRLLFLLDSLIR